MGDTGVTLTESCEGLSSATVVPTTHSLGQGFIFGGVGQGGGRDTGHGLTRPLPLLLRLVLKYMS